MLKVHCHSVALSYSKGIVYTLTVTKDIIKKNMQSNQNVD